MTNTLRAGADLVRAVTTLFLLGLPGCGALPSTHLAMTGGNFTHLDLNGLAYPRAILVGTEGSITVAGGSELDSTGFVASLSSSGQTEWIYKRPSDDASKPSWVHKASTRFADSMTLPGGSMMLCGSLGVAPVRPIPALVTILDAKGKLTQELHVLPRDSRHDIAHIDTCKPWKNGILFAGPSFSKGPAGVGGSQDYWISYFDSSLRPVWETFVTSKNARLNYLGSQSGIAFKTQPDRLELLATDDNHSVFISVSNDGRLLNAKLLDGRFTLFSDEPEDEPLLMAYFQGKSAASRIVKIDDRGNIVSSKSIGSLGTFAPKSAYRLSDGSIAMFGARVDGSDVTEIVHLDEVGGLLATLTPEEPGIAHGFGILAVSRVPGRNAFIYGIPRYPRTSRPYKDAPELFGVSIGRINFE